MSCRLYRDDSGHVSGAPSVSQLRRAIEQAFAGPSRTGRPRRSVAGFARPRWAGPDRARRGQQWYTPDGPGANPGGPRTRPNLAPSQRGGGVTTPIGRRRGTCRAAGPFPPALGPNHAGTFPRTWLSSGYAVAAVRAAFTEDTQHRFGALHFAYPFSIRISSHLAPFALRTVFPPSLVRRYSHDYYGACVA